MMEDGGTTYPTDENWPQTLPRLTIAPAYRDDKTGQLYVHRDLEPRNPDWMVADRIGPVRVQERFGDVESWTQYVTRYEDTEISPLLTWSERGLHAILDYHVSEEEPGRCVWTAEHLFVRSIQWQRWVKFADGSPRTQRQVIEAFEDYGPDIAEPPAAELLTILRVLRTSVNASANVNLAEDGSTNVEFTKNSSIKAGDVSLPAQFKIRIPVLKGHTTLDEQQRPVPVQYELTVRLRAGVDDNAHLVLRLTIPSVEAVLEDVFQDRVKRAKDLLGAERELYRGGAS